MSRRPFWLGKITLLALACLAGGEAVARAEFSSRDFDQWYYAAPGSPDARQSVEALNYFVHLTGTADSDFSSEKEYRIFIASRARFFAVRGEGRPAFWQHAESLFPQCFWTQKSLLLEIFKRTHEPGVADSLNAWARSEEDDDRRLILEEAALAGGAPEAVLEKPLSSPQVVAEQWAVFFASGNTSVVEASLRFLRRNPGRVFTGNSGTATGENLPSANSALREVIWEKLEQFSRVYPQVRQALQTGLLGQPLAGTDLKRALETLAWQDLDNGDTLGAQGLLPLAETAWSGEAEKIELFKGELAWLNHQPGEVENAVHRLLAAEPMWVERLAAFQAICQRRQAELVQTWSSPQSGGEQYSRLGAKYLAGLKSSRTVDVLTIQPWFISGDEKAEVREQVRSLKMPATFKGWQDSGRTQSAWKIENDSLFLWTGSVGHAWAEVRDPQVRARILKAAALDTWIDLLTRQVPKEMRESEAAPAGRVQLVYETPDYDLAELWGGTMRFIPPLSPEGNKAPLRFIVELSKTDGKVEAIVAEITDARSRTCRLEKLFFDQNIVP
jgi:hypothetical protein